MSKHQDAVLSTAMEHRIFLALSTISVSHRWSSWMRFIRFVIVSLFALVALLPARAQSPESYRGMLTARVRADKLPPPQHLKDYVQDGKLTLGLRDAILLTLENNSNVQIEETQIEAQKFNLLGQFQPFDPVAAEQPQHQSILRPPLTANCRELAASANANAELT